MQWPYVMTQEECQSIVPNTLRRHGITCWLTTFLPLGSVFCVFEGFEFRKLFRSVLLLLLRLQQTSIRFLILGLFVLYFQAYPALTDYLKSALYHWGGDAAQFKHAEENNSYIELVTTPNNPSGEARYPVVNGSGSVIYDLAYYWPHYTPITSQVDEDVMLFTLSKSTGHAGTRIGCVLIGIFTCIHNIIRTCYANMSLDFFNFASTFLLFIG